jgi:hypothetical protein
MEGAAITLSSPKQNFPASELLPEDAFESISFEWRTFRRFISILTAKPRKFIERCKKE